MGSTSDWSESIVVADLTDEPALSDELAVLIQRIDRARSTPHIVLNMSDVTYVGSSNVGMIVQLRQRLSSKGRKLTLCGASDDVRSIFSITGLDRLLRFAPDPMTALAGLQLEEAAS
jgi:anti-anti-sigma factor